MKGAVRCALAMLALYGPSNAAGAAQSDGGTLLTLACTGQAAVQYPVLGAQSRSDTATVDVELRGSDARIRIPPVLAPQLNDGTTDHWYPIRDLYVDEGRIAGRVRLNFATVVRLSIDRRSGQILVGDSFRGDCGAVETSKPKF